MPFRLDSDMNAYLRPTPEIDFEHPLVESVVIQHRWESLSAVDRARAAFEFVRDEIDHSADVQSKVVTRTASEVLTHRVGICYAKSHLLAALLRRMEIPSGMCYQRLTLLDDASGGYAIHSLNAAYFEELGRWIRFDARGNKPGVDARFSLDQEHLAFSVRSEFDEVDYGVIHASAAPETLLPLLSCSDAEDMYLHHLPSSLTY